MGHEEQPEPDLLAQLDQLRRGLEDIAGILGDYFKHLLNNGFEREEALTLVIAYQRDFLGGGDEGS